MGAESDYMIDLLVIGDTQFDTVMVLDPNEVDILCQLNTHECKMCLDYAGKIPVSQLHGMVAGNAANVAVSGARLHGHTAFWTLLGDDDTAKRQVIHFQREGINTSFVQTVPGAQSNQSTVISVNGERTILVYHAARDYQFPPQLPPAKWVYLTSMGRGSESIFPQLAAYVARIGAKLAYQPGTFQLRLGALQSSELLAATNLIIMNKEEAQKFTDSTNVSDVLVLCQKLRSLGPKVAVVTDGQHGSYGADEHTSWKMGIRPEIPRIESTGAGDAYSSALTVALMEGQPIGEAMRWGTFNSESVIQQIGPQAGILTRDQLAEQLLSRPDFVAKRVES